VLSYYTTPTGKYRVPRATAPAPAPEDEVSQTSADFWPEPIPAPAHTYPSTYGRGYGHGHSYSTDHTGCKPSWISTSAWSARPGKGDIASVKDAAPGTDASKAEWAHTARDKKLTAVEVEHERAWATQSADAGFLCPNVALISTWLDV
jgi:hypothetical protein